MSQRSLAPRCRSSHFPSCCDIHCGPRVWPSVGTANNLSAHWKPPSQRLSKCWCQARARTETTPRQLLFSALKKMHKVQLSHRPLGKCLPWIFQDKVQPALTASLSSPDPSSFPEALIHLPSQLVFHRIWLFSNRLLNLDLARPHPLSSSFYFTAAKNFLLPTLWWLSSLRQGCR